jgi:hypothetical protein
LSYEQENWDYCIGEDRRLYKERLSGIKPAGNSQIVNSLPPHEIPKNCYDVGDGYYDPERKRVYSYPKSDNPNALLRIPGIQTFSTLSLDADEIEWIVSRCRIGI